MQTLEMIQTKPVEVENDVMVSFREQLQAKIAEKNLTQAHIASIMGISAACVSRIIHVNKNITIDTLCSICEAIGCNPEITLK